ncbi:MAG: RHS repeat-associated core domain-containing protein [Planctomycetaceae bacterium]|nr:RHS repeat-associated core domain-containing protein [Planctomycetaceae bacterium]
MKAASGYNWNRTFAWQVLDSEAGLMLYRMRYYHTEFGRFVSRDPVRYKGRDVNLYRYVFSMPINAIDPQGLLSVCCRPLAQGAGGDDSSTETAVKILNIQHRQLRNVCAPGEKSSPVQFDPNPTRNLAGCPAKTCANATQDDVEKCLRNDAKQNNG